MHDPDADMPSLDDPNTSAAADRSLDSSLSALLDTDANTAPDADIQVGFVALVGKPNVGKSTLLNALLGQKVAIVSPRPQTTRVPLRGILNRPDAQLIFVDTPGIHEPNHALGEFMVKLAQRTIPNVDVVCMMVDITIPPTKLDRMIAAQLATSTAPCLLLLNKVDLKPRANGDTSANLQAYRDLAQWDMELALSALTGAGVDALVDELIARVPTGQPLYPPDWVVDQSVQYLAGELVREKVLYFTNYEVPHSSAIEVDEWIEQDNQTVYMRATIYVERDSQKGILIGAGGAMLKRIGSAARRDIETLLDGQRVFLDLWVKTRPNWRNNPASLGWLGYKASDWD